MGFGVVTKRQPEVAEAMQKLQERYNLKIKINKLSFLPDYWHCSEGTRLSYVFEKHCSVDCGT
jgi:hypothetical protein